MSWLWLAGLVEGTKLRRCKRGSNHETRKQKRKNRMNRDKMEIVKENNAHAFLGFSFYFLDCFFFWISSIEKKTNYDRDLERRHKSQRTYCSISNMMETQCWMESLHIHHRCPALRVIAVGNKKSFTQGKTLDQMHSQ